MYSIVCPVKLNVTCEREGDPGGAANRFLNFSGKPHEIKGKFVK